MLANSFVPGFLTVLLLPLAGVAAEVRGIVTRVDPDKQVLTIESRGLGVRGMTLSFIVDKDAEVMMGQQAAKLGDLAPGKHVRLTFETRDGRNVVVRIQGGLLAGLLAPQAAAAPAPADPNAVTGTLQRVALTDREIVVIGPGAQGPETETTFSVPEAAKVMQGDKAVKLDDLKEGVRVAVKPEKRDGKMVAESIQVLGEGAPSASRITQIRRILKLADQFLQMAEETQRAGQP